MSRFYRIRTIRQIMVLERLVYPRIRIFISLEKGLPQLLKISLIEECSVKDIARVIHHINYYLIRYEERIETNPRFLLK